MLIIEVLIITTVLMLIVRLDLSVRSIVTKEGEFHVGACSSHSGKLKDQGIGCGCGNGTCET